MASRILWVLLAGGALVAGIALQDGDAIFGWGDHDARVATSTERTVESRVERAVERGAERMQVVDARGNEVVVSDEAKRALAGAVGRLVEAEVAHAVLGVRDASPGELAAANARRVAARAEVDRLKAQMAAEQGAVSDAAVRAQIQREVREDIRASIRDAVGN